MEKMPNYGKSAKERAAKARGTSDGHMVTSKEKAHKHQFYLKSSGIGGKMWRECDTCGAKRPTTKYRPEI